jgi:hypothetical protein
MFSAFAGAQPKKVRLEMEIFSYGYTIFEVFCYCQMSLRCTVIFCGVCSFRAGQSIYVNHVSLANTTKVQVLTFVAQ